MPKIQWTNLPPALRQHLFERLAERKITAEDLYELKLWRESEPEAPDGPWYKDFGSFKICGEGRFPKTFLLRGQAAKGKAPWVHNRRHLESEAARQTSRRGGKAASNLCARLKRDTPHSVGERRFVTGGDSGRS